MQYGLSEKFDGIVRMVLVVAAVVRDEEKVYNKKSQKVIGRTDK